ncbi:OsmC family protein [Thermodesulfobacteriota bacterium]
MSNSIDVQVNQIGPTASEGSVRDHTVVMDRPETKGGENRGAMGGEHLLMALGGCFMSNLLAAILAREADVSNVKLSVSGTIESAPPRFGSIEMKISADHDDDEQLQKLITIAERGCIVANTLRMDTDLSITTD